jgi:hypothetical protein
MTLEVVTVNLYLSGSERVPESLSWNAVRSRWISIFLPTRCGGYRFNSSDSMKTPTHRTSR